MGNSRVQINEPRLLFKLFGITNCRRHLLMETSSLFLLEYRPMLYINSTSGLGRGQRDSGGTPQYFQWGMG